MSPTPKSLFMSMDLVSNPSLVSHRHLGEASSQSLHHGTSHRCGSPKGWLVLASRVNYLLLCSAQVLMVSADIPVYTAFGFTDTPTSLREMKAVFEDVLCPLLKCPPTFRGSERKQRLVSEGTAIQKERTSFARQSARVWRSRLEAGAECVGPDCLTRCNP